MSRKPQRKKKNSGARSNVGSYRFAYSAVSCLSTSMLLIPFHSSSCSIHTGESSSICTTRPWTASLGGFRNSLPSGSRRGMAISGLHRGLTRSSCWNHCMLTCIALATMCLQIQPESLFEQEGYGTIAVSLVLKNPSVSGCHHLLPESLPQAPARGKKARAQSIAMLRYSLGPISTLDFCCLSSSVRRLSMSSIQASSPCSKMTTQRTCQHRSSSTKSSYTSTLQTPK